MSGFASGGHVPNIGRSVIGDLLGQGFMTCECGNGEPCVKVKFPTLKLTQEFHGALVSAQINKHGEVPSDVRQAVEFTRADLGKSGSNYPHIRSMLAFIEGLMAA